MSAAEDPSSAALAAQRSGDDTGGDTGDHTGDHTAEPATTPSEPGGPTEPTRPGAPAPVFRRRRQIRFRLMVIAVVTVLVALIAGGGLLLVLLQVNLRTAATAAARSRAAEISADLKTSGLAATAATLRQESRSGQVVQVIDASHRVVAASTAVLADRPMTDLRPADGATTVELRDLDDLGTPGDWLVVVRGIRFDGSLYAVQVAVPIEVEKQTVQTVAQFLLGATPILLAAVAGAVWLLVGRTLRPVEEIRLTVAGVRARRLSDRVPVPDSHDEIAALAATMNEMLARLEQSDRAQRAFLSDASHELRSPLAALRASLDLADRAEEPVRRELITTMSSEVDRMSGLVNDLMTLARADDDRLIDKRVEVDLDDVVLSEVRRLRATSVHRVDLGLVPVRVVGDPGRLTQVLRNLLDNAERYARSRIRVGLAVETSEDAGAVGVLRVDNDGPPVPETDRERVFARFVRLGESRASDEGGRGLGLSISQQIAEAHGGRIRATTAPDGDCRFELRIPVRPGSRTDEEGIDG